MGNLRLEGDRYLLVHGMSIARSPRLSQKPLKLILVHLTPLYFLAIITIMNLEKLQTLYREDSAARLLLNRWADRQRRASASEVGGLLRDPQVKEARLERGDVVRVLKALESSECGRFVAGRRGKESRFVWAEDCIRVGAASKGDNGHTGTVAPPQVDRQVLSANELSDSTGLGKPEGTVAPDRSPEVTGDALHMSPGHQRIVVSYRDSSDHGLPKKKAFIGMWIIPPEKPISYRDESGQVESNYCVAITAKKNIAVYTWEESADTPRFNEHFWVYSSFDEAAADRRVNAAITEAIERLGVEIEELDI
jgi:hypothetical protein